MKNPALQRKNLYNKHEVEHSHKMAIYQGMAMVFVTLEWHYGWKQKRLNRLFENLQSIAEIPPIFGKAPDALEQMQHFKQYYQIYNLAKGRFINPRNPVKRICLSATSGDFQGFDLYGTSIYTIEGSPRKSFLLGYDRSRRYQPTKIRRYNYAVRSKKTITVRGAKTLSFREPEGIKVLAGGQIYMMYVSNTLTNQSCNIYRVKRKI